MNELFFTRPSEFYAQHRAFVSRVSWDTETDFVVVSVEQRRRKWVAIASVSAIVPKTKTVSLRGFKRRLRDADDLQGALDQFAANGFSAQPKRKRLTTQRDESEGERFVTERVKRSRRSKWDFDSGFDYDGFDW